MSVRKAFVNISSAILGLTVMGGNVMAGEKVNQKACKTAVEAFEAAKEQMVTGLKIEMGLQKPLPDSKVETTDVVAERVAQTVGKLHEDCKLPFESVVPLSSYPFIVAIPDMLSQPDMKEMDTQAKKYLNQARQAAGLTK